MEPGHSKESKGFERVLNARDIIVIAIGAMIGWGWVVLSGGWITSGGVLGAALGFIIGGVMVFFIGLTYAELTSAMPKCGGEHVFSMRAFGSKTSFACTWGIILGYVGVICFESCTIPLCISYIFPGFLQGYLYTVAGFDIYATWILGSFAIALFLTYINIRGIKLAAIVQTIMTLIIFFVGIFMIVSGLFLGDVSNVTSNAFVGDNSSTMLMGILAVTVLTPFFYIGFDVIPQAAEEINVPFQKIGKIMMFSIIMTVAFYVFIIIAVGLLMTPDQIASSLSGTGITSADAMKLAFSSDAIADVVILGGICGLVTSWNSFLIGSSRAMYAMADSYMIPHVFAKMHPKYHSPVNALILIGVISMLAPLFGREMMTWVVNIANMGCCVAYFLVGLSFLKLRKKEPELERPYKVKHATAVGAIAICMSGFMIMMYLIPGSGSTIGIHEFVILLAWCILGVLFAAYSKMKYKDKFGKPEGEVGTNIETPIEPHMDSGITD